MTKLRDIEPFTVRIELLKFFATGGKVSMSEAIARTGLTYKDLFGFVARKGISYHKLFERVIETTYQEPDQIDFDNEVDSIITGGKAAVFAELMPFYKKEAVYSESYEFIKTLNHELKTERLAKVNKTKSTSKRTH